MWGMSIPCRVLCPIRADWWLKAHRSVSRKWPLVPCMLNEAMASWWLTKTWCSPEYENYSDILWLSWHLKLSATWLFNSLFKLNMKTPKHQWLLGSLKKGQSCQMCFRRADSQFAPSQWDTSLQSNAISHWLGANLESALFQCHFIIMLLVRFCQYLFFFTY